MTDVLVTDCLDGSWCAGKDNTECCRQKKGVFLDNGTQTSQKATSSATSMPTTSSTTPSTASLPSPHPRDSGLSTGAKIGIGLGVGLGALLVLGLIAFFCLRRRSRSKAAPIPQEPPAYWQETHEVPDHSVKPQPQPGSSTKYAHEVGDTTQIYEVEGNRPGDRPT